MAEKCYMMELAPSQITIVRLRTETEMRVLSEKKTLDNRYNRMHVSIFMSNFLFGYNM